MTWIRVCPSWAGLQAPHWSQDGARALGQPGGHRYVPLSSCPPLTQPCGAQTALPSCRVNNPATVHGAPTTTVSVPLPRSLHPLISDHTSRSHLFIPCFGLNCVPLEKYNQVLTPGTCECGIGNRVFPEAINELILAEGGPRSSDWCP